MPGNGLNFKTGLKIQKRIFSKLAQQKWLRLKISTPTYMSKWYIQLWTNGTLLSICPARARSRLIHFYNLASIVLLSVQFFIQQGITCEMRYRTLMCIYICFHMRENFKYLLCWRAQWIHLEQQGHHHNIIKSLLFGDYKRDCFSLLDADRGIFHK